MEWVQGVLLPFLQSSMVGAILYLRLPFITGQSGVILTCVIFFICLVSTFLSLLSLSALASNGKLSKSGSLYQLVSRNLGVELGGAVGLLFYLGKALAGSMYCLGAAEAFLYGIGVPSDSVFPWANQIIALSLCFGLTVLVHHVDAKYIDYCSLFFLVTAFLTILFFTVGGLAFANNTYHGKLSSYDMKTNDNVFGVFQTDPELGYTPTFFSLLALYYPSLTGIMTGSCRPGPVAKPGFSVPFGTCVGMGITSAVYLLVIFLFGFSVRNDTLLNDRLVLAMVSWPHPIVGYTGICLSCVGGSLQAIRQPETPLSNRCRRDTAVLKALCSS